MLPLSLCELCWRYCQGTRALQSGQHVYVCEELAALPRAFQGCGAACLRPDQGGSLGWLSCWWCVGALGWPEYISAPSGICVSQSRAHSVPHPPGERCAGRRGPSLVSRSMWLMGTVHVLCSFSLFLSDFYDGNTDKKV